MSAFVVSRAHIDALVSLAIEGPEGRGPVYPGDTTNRGLSWYSGEPEEIYAEAGGGDEGWAAMSKARREARVETADEVGRMLAFENAASVLYRYPNHDNGQYVPAWTTDESYTHTRWAKKPTAIEGLSIIACFEYQACEHPGWTTSEAHAFCEALRIKLIHCLPGYSDAPWEWTEKHGGRPSTFQRLI